MIDLIPLSEVVAVTPYHIDERMAEIQSSEDVIVNCVQITTLEDGYNSGMYTVANLLSRISPSHVPIIQLGNW